MPDTPINLGANERYTLTLLGAHVIAINESLKEIPYKFAEPVLQAIAQQLREELAARAVATDQLDLL